MTAQRDPDRLIHAFLVEGQTELADQVYDAIRASVERKRQRVVIGPWRMPTMSRLVPVGPVAVAMVVALVAGSRLLGPPAPGGVGGDPSVRPSVAPSVAPSATPAPTRSRAAWFGIPAGPFVVTGANDPVQVTVDIASSGWNPLAAFDAVDKGDDGRDAPATVGAALVAWTWPAGTGFNVYGDACRWSTTLPETPATTPDEIAAAFVAQASSDATAPVDVTVGGFAGKTLTLRVPMSYDLPNATREEKFADCDNDMFAFYGIDGQPDIARNAQGAGQIDELWILNVDGAIVILDATYSPSTPAEVADELHALAESATFR